MYPLLYGKNKNGKIKTWSISVIEQDNKSILITRHGYKDGKIIEQVKEISRKLNIGKVNEMSHSQVAHSEALSKWKKKKEEGYSEEVINIPTTIKPMLAMKYEDHKDKLDFPCYVQPKKDGVRCLYNTDLKHHLLSRTGKVFNNVPHILDDLKSTNINIILDGELFNDSIKFETFTGLMNKLVLTETDVKNLRKTKFVIFDAIFPLYPDMPFSERYEQLKTIFKNNKFSHIQLIETKIVNNHAEIKTKLQEYLSKGDEGVMIRIPSGKYTINYRSKFLLKYKLFYDDEFKIVGFTEGENTEAGCVVWICSTKSGHTFNVRPRGSFDERKVLYKNASKYIGKLLTVRYQELYEQTGIPRFVVGLAIRDYE